MRQAVIAKKQSDAFFKRLINQLKKLNKQTHKAAIQSYDSLIDRLHVDGVSIDNSMENLELLSMYMQGFDQLISKYRTRYQTVYSNSRVELFEYVRDKELRLMKVVAKMGVKDDRISIDQKTLDLLREVNLNMYRNIEKTLIKWRSFVYDAFFVGITQSKTRAALREDFVTNTGTLKIGSSLEEETELEASMAAVRERTAYLREQARRNGYRYCWNVNPMDRRTKPMCMEASLAGVITEEEMGRVHGFPPRHICRCEIAYTHEDWVELNQSINNELRIIRERLIDELVDAPRQLAQYYVGGRLVIPRDPVRASGEKMYADIEEKLETARANEVPDFEP